MGDIGRMVEMSHRLSTSLCGLLAIILIIWGFRLYGPGHAVRKGATAVLALTLFEGLIGAVIVKFGLVTDNDSVMRAMVMAVHVISTFILLGSLLFTGLMASGREAPKFRGQSTILMLLIVGFMGLMLLGVSGAISALGHQLKPVDNVIAASMNPATHWMVRLQPLHPLLGVTVGVYLLFISGLIHHLRPSPFVRQAAQWVVGIYAFQIVVGLLNIVLKAPVGMQMFHLVMADVNFMSVVALGVAALAPSVAHVEDALGSSEPVPQLIGWRAKVGAYISLTKPRIISLLLFTTMMALLAAAGGWPGGTLFFTCLIGGYMAAGAANAINMVIDRDIDQTMERTAKRPTVTQAISSTHALVFAFSLAVISFAILWIGANLLAAMLALAGLAFYVVVYTLLLKRRTWHNIVIGGAAGSFPPLVGWTAYTNELSPIAWILFAIIFVWTPVHFWALALLIKDEYAEANVPMLPVVHGERATAVQIVLYAIVTAIVSTLPVLFPSQDRPHVAQTYLVTALVLNVVLLVMSVQLLRQTDRPHAFRLFKFSMVYLAVLFLVFAIDCSIPKSSSPASRQASHHHGSLSGDQGVLNLVGGTERT